MLPKSYSNGQCRHLGYSLKNTNWCKTELRCYVKSYVVMFEYMEFVGEREMLNVEMDTLSGQYQFYLNVIEQVISENT